MYVLWILCMYYVWMYGCIMYGCNSIRPIVIGQPKLITRYGPRLPLPAVSPGSFFLGFLDWGGWPFFSLIKHLSPAHATRSIPPCHLAPESSPDTRSPFLQVAADQVTAAQTTSLTTALVLAVAPADKGLLATTPTVPFLSLSLFLLFLTHTHTHT
jgi:hypothetical protein